MNRKEERRQRWADSGAQMPSPEPEPEPVGLGLLGFDCRRVGKSFDFTEREKAHEIPSALPSEVCRLKWGDPRMDAHGPHPSAGKRRGSPQHRHVGEWRSCSSGLKGTNNPKTL